MTTMMQTVTDVKVIPAGRNAWCVVLDGRVIYTGGQNDADLIANAFMMNAELQTTVIDQRYTIDSQAVKISALMIENYQLKRQLKEGAK